MEEATGLIRVKGEPDLVLTERRLIPSTGRAAGTLVIAADGPLQRVEAAVRGPEARTGVLRHQSQVPDDL